MGRMAIIIPDRWLAVPPTNKSRLYTEVLPIDNWRKEPRRQMGDEYE